MPLNIAVLRETQDGERRVAVDPTVASRLAKLGFSVAIEKGAGDLAGFPDDTYSDVEFVDSASQAIAGAQIIAKVLPPDADQAAQMKDGDVLVSYMYPHANHDLVKTLANGGVSSLSMELIPRITRAQAMDALSSQATVSGYQSALMAAQLAPRLFPMLTTAAGTIRPARVVVIGAGVAGLQAIATARRLGAQVEAYDIRPAAKEQVESLGAKLIDTGVNAEGEGGYARELTDDEKQQQADALARHIAKAHAVISTAAIPGRPAPKIITQAMVEAMPPGGVIIDLAAETGGNCEVTVPGETVEHGDKRIHGPLNVPSLAPVHASEMYAKNILNLLTSMIEDEEFVINLEDEVVAGCLLTHKGSVTHAPTREAMGIAAPAPIAQKGSDEAEQTPTSASTQHFLEAPQGEADDLKKISGVGPKLEGVLNNAGIYHYWQIARLDAEALAILDEKLKFKGRIQRDGWIDQAKTLMGGE
ncbi:MAG: NAD(P)(+) transhydrogenase (Re/Si-specific) subunit alpha [Pseudomonadota bacterium]